MLGAVEEHEVRRVFRDKLGGWSVEVVVNDRVRIGVLDDYPSGPLLRLLRSSGANIADDAPAEDTMSDAQA
jgi:hypothetical protein